MLKIATPLKDAQERGVTGKPLLFIGKSGPGAVLKGPDPLTSRCPNLV